MVIEIFVYVCIASMMVVCVKVVNKKGIIKKSDFIYFYILLSLIILQFVITTLIFSPFTLHLSDSLPSISSVCLGVILVLTLIYIITHIMDSSSETQEYARTSTGYGMFIAFCVSILGILIWYPETKTDLNRMPFALAICIGMQYYPSVYERLVKLKKAPKQDIEEQNEVEINLTNEKSYEEHEEAIMELTTEAWYLAKIFERAILQLNIDQPRRYTSRIEWFLKKAEESLNDVGLRIVNVEGHAYDAGMAADPVDPPKNIGVDDYLEVTWMVEPIIMRGTDLMKRGKVYLRRTES